MKRLALTLAIATLALPTAALGKGPTAATLEGPGIGDGISFTGYEGTGRLGYLTQATGFFAAVLGQQPNPMLAARPKGDLGPEYTLTYGVPGGGSTAKVVQTIYPYAPDGPVMYTAAGQDMFGMKSRGGWFQGAPHLKATLVEAGLPASASSSSSDGSSFPAPTVSLLVFALLLVGATAVLLRRRARPAPAA